MSAGVGLGCLILAAMADWAGGEPDRHAGVERFRQDYEASLRAEDGWLSVAGLFWLRPGATRIGSDPTSDVLLPPAAPARVGVLTLQESGAAEFRPEPGVPVKKGSALFSGGPVRSDADGKADVLAVGDLRLVLIRRGTRYALRLKDNRSSLRETFAGLRWYPVSDAWVVQGRFVANPPGTKLMLDTIVGEREAVASPGFVEFENEGATVRLQAAVEGNSLWFVFRDGTSGRTTHPGARQLLAAPAKGGVVELDFNRATNLPCAYTPFATCPLAPPQNRLPFPIPAGEQTYHALGR